MPNALCPTCHRHADLCECRYGRARATKLRVQLEADAEARRAAQEELTAAAHAARAARRTAQPAP
jgi:hypothetical protein